MFERSSVLGGLRVLVLTCFSPCLLGQHDIPLGHWRSHFSYASIEHVAATPEKIFASAENAIMVLDRSGFEVTTLTRLNGLSGSDISTMNADPVQSKVLIGYADGLLDILEGNSISSFNRLTEASTTSRRINHIGFHNAYAYLSTDFGVVVFDLDQLEIRETWRDLGVDGSTLPIFNSTVLGDSIYLATERGVLAGLLSDNLLDYTKWNRYDENELSGPIDDVAAFDGSVHATVDETGIFRFDGVDWVQLPFLSGATFNFLSSSEVQLLIGTPEGVFSLANNDELNLILSEEITNPKDAHSDSPARFWIGDQNNGLIFVDNGASQTFVANGPSFPVPFRLRYANDRLYAVAGGWATSGQPLDQTGKVSFFSEGQWTNQTAQLTDVTAISFAGDVQYLSSYGGGIQAGGIPAPTLIYDETNSSLMKAQSPGEFILVTDIAGDRDRLWATNYNTDVPLHLYSEGQWQPFSFPWFAARYPTSLLVDVNGVVWYAANPQQGGGLVVYNSGNNNSVYLTDQVNAGGLPDRAVYCLTSDRDGSVWAGTASGVAYFPSPSSVFNGNVNAIRPIFENRFLLNEERITAIAVDGGNRKWIGTEKGAWLFSPSGDELIIHFTTDNSPLPSDEVTSIAIDPVSGEVFFGTSGGIVSYRSDASESEFQFDQVKIFPNPVTPEYNGIVGITGLATDAIVKITEVSGKLVSQMNANGGTATWNVLNGNGVRVSSGVYLVFSVTADGSEHYVGKIAVVE